MDSKVIDFEAIRKPEGNDTKEEILQALKNSVEHFYSEEELDKIITDKQEQGIELVTSSVNDVLVYGKYLCSRDSNIHYVETRMCTSLKSDFYRLNIIYRNNTPSIQYKNVAFIPHNILASILYHLVDKEIVSIEAVF